MALLSKLPTHTIAAEVYEWIRGGGGYSYYDNPGKYTLLGILPFVILPDQEDIFEWDGGGKSYKVASRIFPSDGIPILLVEELAESWRDRLDNR